MATDFRLKEQLPRLTEQIVATYSTVGKINHLGHCPLPQFEAIIEILADLKEIIFPGYQRRENLHLGKRAISRRRFDRWPPRQAHSPDLPRFAAR